MNNLKNMCSIHDTTVLKNLILENPKLPVLLFCGEEAWSGEHGYTQATATSGEIKKLTLYKDHWLAKDDYEVCLFDDLAEAKEYENLSDEEYEKMIAKKVEETEFVEAITIYIG